MQLRLLDHQQPRNDKELPKKLAPLPPQGPQPRQDRRRRAPTDYDAHEEAAADAARVPPPKVPQPHQEPHKRPGTARPDIHRIRGKHVRRPHKPVLGKDL